ncbi:Chaperone protein like [Senna tora]|uniref:Chaperone protein like n=1 Tax=Senna tora TaxID=362788 RepID=A0A834WWQ2_9FABA|nr:Chaperone protein like [Senna tora]
MAHYSYGPLRKEPGRARASWWLGATRLWSACFRKRRRRNVVSSEERTQLFDRRLKAFASSPSIDMQVSRWRNVFSLKSYVIPSTIAPTNFSAFHSTPCCFEKWKNKWNSHIKGGQQPSKSYVKYVIRQKRADAKKALKNILYRSGSSKFPLERHGSLKEIKIMIQMAVTTNVKQSLASDLENRKRELSEKSKERLSARTLILIPRQRSKQRLVTNRTPGPLETHGGHLMRIQPLVLNGGSIHIQIGQTAEIEGPLKIEDVKNAFRLSAMKWHPDKHQGPSQAVAEEKFKVCVNAYKSLCNVLSPALVAVWHGELVASPLVLEAIDASEGASFEGRWLASSLRFSRNGVGLWCSEPVKLSPLGSLLGDDAVLAGGGGGDRSPPWICFLKSEWRKEGRVLLLPNPNSK